MTRTMRLGASLLFCVFGGLSASAQISTCPVGYAQPRTYDRGTALRVAVAVADFDNDGRPDIASLHRSGDDGTTNRTGTVLLNRGQDAFDTKPIIAAGDFATIRAGFVNNDGFPDLILGGSAPLTILYGNGDGTFRLGAVVDVRNVTSIAIGQLDSKNGNDIAVTQSLPAAFTVVTSNADGSFAVGTSMGLADRGVAVAAADFDGDGRTDAAVADASSVTPFYANGDGTFTKGASIANVPPTSLAAGDVDGDGRADIVVGGKNSLLVLVYAGGRSFRLNGITALNGDANSTTLTDLNHDAFPDVVIAGTGDVAVFLGTPGGHFAPPVLYGAGADPEFGAAADFNSDGQNDVVVSNMGSSDISILRNTGGGALDAMRQLQANEGAIALAVNDVDQVGGPELIVATNLTNEVRMFTPEGSWFTPLSGNQLGFTPRMMRLGDVNGDGRADLALLSADNKTIGILPTVMGGLFAAPTTLTFPELCCFALTDLNNDHLDDLVTANQTGGLSVRFSTGGTSFSTATNYTLPDPVTAMTVGDFDRDGNNDVAVATHVQIFIFNGLPNGDLSLNTVLDVVGTKQLETGLISDDVFPDLVALGSDVTVFYNTQGVFNSQVHLTLPAEEPTSVTIADLNADKKNDIAVTSFGVGGTFNWLTIYTQRPDLGFDAQPAIQIDAKPVAVVAADFLGNDGRPEIAVAAAGKTFISRYRCATPAVTVGVPRSITPGQPATFVANIVNGTADGATYTFFVDGKVAAAVASNPNEPGIARANLTLTPGTHTVSVTVLYKENTSASSDPISVTAGTGKRRAVRH